jgi:hypothetical protein
VTGETLLDGEEEEVDDDDEKDDDNIESDAMIKVGRRQTIRFISRCNACVTTTITGFIIQLR